MSRNYKCTPQFCYFIKFINVINGIEFTIVIKHDTLSKYYKKLLNF